MEIVFQAGRQVEWETFIGVPGPALALDGYVPGTSQFCSGHISFDYHGDCDRLTTRTTAEQVFLALSGGCPILFEEDLKIYINHVDPEVALSIWLITNWETILNDEERGRVRRLVEIAAALDSSNGVLSEASDSELSNLAWVGEAWIRKQQGGDLSDIEVLEHLMDRTSQYVHGVTVGYKNLSKAYTELGRIGEVVIVRENHPFGRAMLASSGEKYFVSVRKDEQGNHFRFGSLCPWSGVPMERVYEMLNNIDGSTGWGGNSFLGGSPSGGTAMSAEEVAGVISSVSHHIQDEGKA